MPDFLMEIGCEEIPARMIDPAREELARRVQALLQRERLLPDGAGNEPVSFSTPRRIAVVVSNISSAQPDVTEQLTGPSIKVAYKDGAPTPAAEAFARKAGVKIEQLEKTITPKGEYLTATVKKTGRGASEVLAESLPAEIAALYWPKNMYWRGQAQERFVRPVRWLVAMLGGEVVPLEFGGVMAGDQTRDHRQLGSKPIRIGSAGNYAQALAAAHVVADPAAREARIRKALDAAARTVSGVRWREDAALLNTVVNLTEFPFAILGSFDPQFLSLPEEVLVTVMRDHQKYFALEDASGKLAPYFLAVLNTEADAAGAIRHGNERVLRARFNDARFFWETDQARPLSARVEMLKAVTFQKDLGSYHAKTERIMRLADIVGKDLEATGVKVDGGAVRSAAQLAKADLTTELVKEFTELQGIIGGLYAGAQGLPAAVATAIYDQYRPASMEEGKPNDGPRSNEGAVLAIADKADSIAGMFALGLRPTGSRDPFALRRQANGIVKTAAQRGFQLSLMKLMRDALAGYAGSPAVSRFSASADYAPAVAAFFRERVEFYLRDVLKFAYDEVNAVLAEGAGAGADDILDALSRARAVSQVRRSQGDDFQSIASAFKRIKNILRQAREADKSIAPSLDPKAFRDDAERALFGAMESARPKVEQHRQKADYAAALAEIARLRPAVDAFFDKVMVMVDDAELRANRLALLRKLYSDFSGIADFSEIVTERKA